MKKFKHFKIKKRGVYTYFQCKQCHAFLHSKKEKIRKYQNLHIHRSSKKDEEEKVLELLSEKYSLCPVTIDIKEIAELLNLKERRIKYIIQKNTSGLTFQELLHQLEAKPIFSRF